MIWPDDADGDVMRSLEDSGFDFSREHAIDFNVDFEDWPPPDEALLAIRRKFPDAEVYEPEDEDPGYVLFQVRAPVSYELVMRVQRETTELMAPFDGRCEFWGVLQEEP
jgi:hypothetical protein